jgi:membrane glycosyltransferase
MLVYEIALGILLASIVQSLIASAIMAWRRRAQVKVLRARLAVLEAQERDAQATD